MRAAPAAAKAFDMLPLQRTELPGGLVFHHVEQGQGTPIVFVHGVLGDWRTWAPQWPAFVPHGRALSYSRRYSVPNGNRQASPDHSALVEAEDLAALLLRWQAAPAVLVASSYGAYTALALAAQWPERVRALVLLEPPMLYLADTTAEGRALRLTFDRDIRGPARAAFERGDDAQAVCLLTEGIVGRQAMAAMPTAALQRRLENALSIRMLTLSRDEFPPLDLAALARLEQPLMLMRGADTAPIHRVVFEALVRALPRAETAIVPAAGHGAARDNPGVFNALALDFLARRVSL